MMRTMQQGMLVVTTALIGRIAASSVKKLFAGKKKESPASTTGPLSSNILGAGCIAGSLIFRR